MPMAPQHLGRHEDSRGWQCTPWIDLGGSGAPDHTSGVHGPENRREVGGLGGACRQPLVDFTAVPQLSGGAGLNVLHPSFRSDSSVESFDQISMF